MKSQKFAIYGPFICTRKMGNPNPTNGIINFNSDKNHTRTPLFQQSIRDDLRRIGIYEASNLRVDG